MDLAVWSGFRIRRLSQSLTGKSGSREQKSALKRALAVCVCRSSTFALCVAGRTSWKAVLYFAIVNLSKYSLGVSLSPKCLWVLPPRSIAAD